MFLDHGAMDNDYTIRCLSMKTFAMSFVGNSDENKVFMYEDFVEQFSDIIENMNAPLLETQSLAYGFKCIVTTYPEKMDEVLSLFLKMSAAKRISDPFAAYLFRSIAFATGYSSMHDMIVDHMAEILYKYIDLRNPWNIELVEFPVDIVFSKTRIPNVEAFCSNLNIK